MKQQLIRSVGDGYQPMQSVGRAEALWWPGTTTQQPLAERSSGDRVLINIAHVTDLHVIDASSPSRAEHTELLGAIAKWRIMLPMHRPYELLTNHALAMMCQTIRRDPYSPHSDTPYDMALVTGDCIDNAQRNELDTYLAILGGGTVHLPYDGVQSVAATVGAEEAFFWCPDPHVDDRWKRTYGFPGVEGLLEAISQPYVCSGIGLQWLAAIGNHDVMLQGTAFTSERSEVLAVGDQKATAMPSSFDPDDPLGAYLNDPADYVIEAPTRLVRADANRRTVSQTEWVAAHQSIRAGFDGANARGADYVRDLDHVRVIVMDTNHPYGHYEGSIGAAQVAWLEDRIAETEKWIVLATHHGLAALNNETPPSPQRDDVSYGERLLADAVALVLHRHDRVLAWLNGHRHYHRVVHHPHPESRTEGFWEITTGSIIDWPSQARAVEIVQRADKSIVIICTPIDHDGDVIPGPDAAGSLAGIAGLHRELAANVMAMGGARRVTNPDQTGVLHLGVRSGP
jgi:metallophosphoesterase (TIGR03767 family)